MNPHECADQTHRQSRGYYFTSKQLTKVLDLTLIQINLYKFRYACRYEEITLSCLMKLTFCCMYFLCNLKQDAARFPPHNFYEGSMKEFHSIKKPIIYISHIL